jgi:hypothetical protein
MLWVMHPETQHPVVYKNPIHFIPEADRILCLQRIYARGMLYVPARPQMESKHWKSDPPLMVVPPTGQEVTTAYP